ncbi:MAG TPA: hypothetical protein VHX44_03525 [Planctomycetota bacterium]|jgi:hypothetical protein|nr:hypothetical protein [Planctomycetota bacterium]
MRNALTIWLITALLTLAGCGSSRVDRAQAGADLDAGLVAAIDAIAANATADAIAILTGARKYVAPAVGAPRAELPTPRMDPPAIRHDPAAYGASAPPDPKPWSFWAVAGGAGVLALALFRAVAPLIPGTGPLIKGAADLVWSLMATHDQKRTDQAQATITQAATIAQPLMDALRAVPPSDLPPALSIALGDPLISQAIQHLATKPATIAA